MGVSVDNGDLNAIIDGGEAFIKRLADMQASKAALDAAVAELNLGKAARDAHNEAARILGEAKNKRDADMAALAKEVDDARSAVYAWSESMKSQAQANVDASNVTLAQAKASHEAAEALRQEAQAAATTAQDKAAKILSDASAQASALVDAAQAKADDLLKQASDAQARAMQDRADAMALKEKYEAMVNKIQGALASE